ncbi:MAG: sigma-70 family RNA polymerase sigma factor [Myxococcota bacterium]|nr:sigma-70 family RNA polymerase sigma factor [Myxococcota bacterium]
MTRKIQTKLAEKPRGHRRPVRAAAVRREESRRAGRSRKVAHTPLPAELEAPAEEVELPVAALEDDVEPSADGGPEEALDMLPDEELAEAEDEEQEERAAADDADTSSNFLATYFKEMSRLAVLRPEEEFEIARRIGELETDLWVKLLSFAPLTDLLLQVVERTIDNSLPEFRALRQAAARTQQQGQLSDEDLVRAAQPVAEKLRKLDIDRIYVGVVLDEVKKIATGAPGRLIDTPVQVDLQSRPFRRYLHDISVTLRRVQRAKNEFVKANLRLVVSIARRFNHGRMPLADLIQEGNIGLIKAVERFDYRRGYRFSTYASWWIRHAISRGLADKGRAVRLPVHMIDVYHRVARSKRELSGKLGRQPTNEELGAATGLAVSKIEKMRSYLLDQSLSLDRAISDKDGRRFIDFMQDESPASQPSELLVHAAMTSEVRKLLADLKPIEADILRQRFGLDDAEELTLKEIGEKYNLSRERIRQLQEQALLKMRRALVRRDMV